MIKTVSSNFAEFVGGKHSLEAKSYILCLPVIIASSLLVNIDFHRPEIFIPIIFVNFLAISVCAVYFLIIRATLYKNRKVKPVPLPSVLFFGASIGFLKGFLSGIFINTILPNSETPLLTRTVTTTFAGMWLVVVLAIINGLIENFKAERTHLLFELSRQNKKVDSQLTTISASSLETIRVFVRQAKLSLSKVSNKASPEIFEAISDIVDRNLRPASHKIWRAESKRYTDYSVRELISVCARDFAFSSLIVVPIYMVTGFPILISHMGLTESLGYICIAGGVACTYFELTRLQKIQSLVLGWVRFVVIILAIAATNYWVRVLFFHSHFDEHTLPFFIIDVLWLAELSLISGMARVAISTHEEVKLKLQELVSSQTGSAKSPSGSDMLEARELANYLHGEVQNRLLRSALKIKSLETSTDREHMRVELLNVETMLDSIEEGFGARVGASTYDEIAEICESWAGVVNVDLKLTNPPECEKALRSIPKASGHDLAQALNESISNAYRHGLANHVSIAIDYLGNHLVIQVVDNGIGTTAGAAGLGTKLFDSITNRDWTLKQNEGGGSTLKLVLDLS